jgi:hemerythrin
MEQTDNQDALVWRSEYNINNFKIDTEHQKLFAIAREALNTTKLKDDDEITIKLKEIITKLFEYVDYHFTNEEEYMKEISYPELSNHILLHENIKEMLEKLLLEINNMELSQIEKTLYDFIGDYIVKHIIQEDKKIQLWNTSLDDLKTNFGWKEIYSLNNEQLDDEHKNLFKIAEEAFAVVEPELKHEKIKTVLNKLYEYMKTHFSHEEEYMQEINYPQFEIHKEFHENIVKTINDFVKQLATLSEDSFEKELARLIDVTIVHHIVQEDKKIITWLKANSNQSDS